MLLGESYLPILHISKVLIKLTCSVRIFCQWHFSWRAIACCGLLSTSWETWCCSPAEAGAYYYLSIVLSIGKGCALRKENALMLLLMSQVCILIQEWFPVCTEASHWRSINKFIGDIYWGGLALGTVCMHLVSLPCEQWCTNLGWCSWYFIYKKCSWCKYFLQHIRFFKITCCKH